MKKLFSGKKLIIVIVGAALILAAGAAVFALPTLKGTPVVALWAAANASPSPTPTPDPAHVLGPGMMYSMKERIVNLADQGGFHYLKSAVVIEFDLPDARSLKAEAYKKRQETFAGELASSQPILDDILTTTMGSKASLVLNTPEGKESLRQELKAKFSEVVGEYKLVNVYFTQFIIQ
ncbi:MAG: flagellar basal body-associated FliL family protein [Dehalococcoidia bacterium]|nr:flagellar basal body-associated FliL family protein [Dehalococcoidia bacterium]